MVRYVIFSNVFKFDYNSSLYITKRLVYNTKRLVANHVISKIT